MRAEKEQALSSALKVLQEDRRQLVVTREGIDKAIDRKDKEILQVKQMMAE